MAEIGFQSVLSFTFKYHVNIADRGADRKCQLGFSAF